MKKVFISAFISLTLTALAGVFIDGVVQETVGVTGTPWTAMGYLTNTPNTSIFMGTNSIILGTNLVALTSERVNGTNALILIPGGSTNRYIILLGE